MAKLTAKQKQQIALASYESVEFFAFQICNSKLRPKQIEFANNWKANRRITFKGGVGFGKTHIMAILVLWSLFTHNNVQVTIFGPSDDQIKNGIWKEIGNIWGKMDAEWKELFDYQATRLSRKDSPSGAFAAYRLANKDNVESARGIHMRNNFVFVDEATGVPDEIFHVLGNIFSDFNPKLCLISNPSRTSGYFFDTWEHPEMSAIWTKVHGRMSDNPDLTAEAGHEMAISYGGKGSRDYRIHVEGEFPLEEVDGVIPRDAVIRAIDNEDAIPPHDAPFVWGVDPNGGGADKSVLAIRQDNVMPELPTDFKGLDAVQLAQAIYDKYQRTPIKQRPVEICVDANGPGYGVYTMMLNMGLPVKKVMVQNSPTRDPMIYTRLRDQLWWACREWFLDGNVSIPNHPDLISELTFPTFDRDSGKIKVEDKKSIRKRGRRSPDFADALCLTFASNRTANSGKYAWSKPIDYDVRAYE